MWWQPRDIIINIYIPRVGSFEITEKDLAAPTSMSFERHDHFHVLCLHAISTSGFPLVDGKFHLAEGQVDELRKQLRIDPRCFRFGRFAVIILARPFIMKITKLLLRDKSPVLGDFDRNLCLSWGKQFKSTGLVREDGTVPHLVSTKLIFHSGYGAVCP
jgi:hypothetical protein